MDLKTGSWNKHVNELDVSASSITFLVSNEMTFNE